MNWKIAPHTWRREWDSNPRHGRTREPDFEEGAHPMRTRCAPLRARRFGGLKSALCGGISRTLLVTCVAALRKR